MTERILRGFVGFACGLLAGLVVTLGVVVARARLEGVYLHAFAEVVGWVALPFLVFPLLGAFVAASTRFRLGPVALAGVVGLLVGIGVGAATGALLSADPAWTWAGGVLGGATGVVAGFVGRIVRDVRGRPGGDRRGGEGSAAAALATLLAIGAAGSCGEADAVLPTAEQGPGEPDPSEVASVVYLVGDPGVTGDVAHPALAAVRRDVERWSAGLGGDGRVNVLVLGDIVYPSGLADPGSEAYVADTAHVAEQVGVVAGPEARRAGARAIFTPGNHDWGNEEEWSGAARLHRLADYLEGWRSLGVDARLAPAPGTGGPSVIDVGGGLRLIVIDTAWWLFDSNETTRNDVLRGVAEALATAGSRRTVVAAHHPLRSGGPHGDLYAVGSTLGLRTVLARSGAMLQDLHSEPYRELLTRLEDTFREHGPPDVFAGGHEHSLQVIRRVRPTDPRMNLVSGSAAKLTDVDPVDGTVFAASAPGYMRLFVMDDGDLRLTVEAAPPEHLTCATTPPGTRDDCMEQGVAAYRTVWSGVI